RLGLVIAKKNVRRAVDRNKVKRIARESFRHHRAELDNLDIVVLARKGLGELDNAALHVLFRDMWRRLIKAADKYHRSSNSGRPSSNSYSRVRTDQGLPLRYQSADGQSLSFLPILFLLCPGSHRRTWLAQGRLPRARAPARWQPRNPGGQCPLTTKKQRSAQIAE